MKCEPSQGKTSPATTLREILVVDGDPKTTELFRAGGGISVRSATSIEQAALEMKHRPVDMMVVNLQTTDNRGMELLSHVRKRFPRTETVAFTRIRDHELCLGAWRAGASDMLMELTPVEVKACIARAHERRSTRDQLAARHQRLRGVCRSLNKARHEISQQVNLLCHDLVRAYQELAEQLNQTQTGGDFASTVGNDVEIEILMRRTMEWLLKKLGPANAAVYLPDAEGNFTLGAYLNFDTNADSVLVDVIAQTIVPQAAGSTAPLAIDSDKAVHDLFGKEGNMLAGRSWLGCGSYYRNECLAVTVVFRNQTDPLDSSWPALLEAMGPILADKIARSIRVYQRGGHEGDESSDSGFNDASV